MVEQMNKEEINGEHRNKEEMNGERNTHDPTQPHTTPHNLARHTQQQHKSRRKPVASTAPTHALAAALATRSSCASR